MKKLVVKESKEFGTYILVDTNSKKEYEMVLDFHKLKKPQVGDIFVMHDEYLTKQSQFFSKMYSFEPSQEMSAKKIIDNNERDFVVFGHNGTTCVLRRIYG